MKYLEVMKIGYTQQYRFQNCRFKRSLPFDFYLPDHNCCIEFDGIQHFKPTSFKSDKSDVACLTNLEETQIKDSLKTKFCDECGIKLLRIPYWQFSKIESILSTFISAFL